MYSTPSDKSIFRNHPEKLNCTIRSTLRSFFTISSLRRSGGVFQTGSKVIFGRNRLLLKILLVFLFPLPLYSGPIEDNPPVDGESGTVHWIKIWLPDNAKIVDLSEKEEAIQDKAAESPLRDLPETKYGPLVKVEPSPMVQTNITGQLYFVPYRSRRQKWGEIIGISASTFAPTKYVSSFFPASNFADVYEKADVPMFEIHFVVKRNYQWASLGFDFGVGYFKASAGKDLGNPELTFYPLRAGARVNFDTFYLEPYVVPYIASGVYSVFYKEAVSGSNAVEGNSQASLYASVGLLFQTNWLDKAAARQSYLDSGIENTFLFLEARNFFSTGIKEEDPNLESIHLNLGLSIEI